MANATKKKPIFPIILVPIPVQQHNYVPNIFPSGTGNAPIGASEAKFSQFLQQYFGEWVRPQQELYLPSHSRPYTADFALVEPTTGLHLDIEVDESHSFTTGTPTHFVGDDDYRNQCFVEANWVVIRFAEEQVVAQPLRCCRFIGNALSSLTGDNLIKAQFTDILPVTPLEQWNKGYARTLKKKSYRNSYLDTKL